MSRAILTTRAGLLIRSASLTSVYYKERTQSLSVLLLQLLTCCWPAEICLSHRWSALKRKSNVQCLVLCCREYDDYDNRSRIPHACATDELLCLLMAFSPALIEGVLIENWMWSVLSFSVMFASSCWIWAKNVHRRCCVGQDRIWKPAGFGLPLFTISMGKRWSKCYHYCIWILFIH